jgi:hypothetical protein
LANGAAIWAIRKQIDFANISAARSPEEIAEALRIKLGDFLAEDGKEELMLAALRELGQDDDAGEAVIKFIQ